MLKEYVLKIFSIINIIYPKKSKNIIFISSPDFTDNSFATFIYMLGNSSKGYKYIWLVDDAENNRLYLDMTKKYINISNKSLQNIKIIKKKSIAGMLAYIQSKYIFFTHGFYTGMSLPKRQVRMNLWHGMPLKAIGYLNIHGDNSTIPKSSFTLATSDLYQDIMSKVFALSLDNVFVTGQPRCNLLFEKSNCLNKLGITRESYKKIIFWAPTYRHSLDFKIKDGLFNHHLPILKENELEELNIYLKSIDTFMLIKLHPMDILNSYDFELFTNIKVIKDRVLLEESCQLYSLLSEVDILLTDYSSIYIDFLLLDRPIIFAIDDFEAYKNTRDFVFKKPEQYMPGHLVSTLKSLKTALNDIIINDSDKYAKKRKEFKKEFHKYENSFSKRLIKNLKL